MQPPAFPDDCHRRSLGREKKCNLCVRRRIDLGPAGTPEGANPGVSPLHMFGCVEEGDILWVGSWPSALDILNPEGIELFRDSHFVVHAKRNALGLRAVSQGRIIDHDLLRIHISRTDWVSQRRGVCKRFVQDKNPPHSRGKRAKAEDEDEFEYDYDWGTRAREKNRPLE